MADEAENTAEPKKKLPIKTIAILASILVIEAVVITGVVLTIGKPADVKADPAAEDEAAMAEASVEELVLADKFPNTKRGRTFIYDTEVYIVVRRKHQPEIQGKLASMAAQMPFP